MCSLPPPPTHLPYYIIAVVDSVDEVTLLFVFSSLSNWREGDKDTNLYTSSDFTSSCSTPINLPAHSSIAFSASLEKTKFPASNSSQAVSKVTTDSDAKVAKPAADPNYGAPSSGSSLAGAQEKKQYILPGRLVVQKFSWRTVQFGDPVLRISTTGTKGVAITLPPG